MSAVLWAFLWLMLGCLIGVTTGLLLARAVMKGHQ